MQKVSWTRQKLEHNYCNYFINIVNKRKVLKIVAKNSDFSRSLIYEEEIMSKSLFTIRKKKKERHPQIIVGATRTSFDSVSLTHSKKHGHSTNKRIVVNPNPKDNRDAFFQKNYY